MKKMETVVLFDNPEYKNMFAGYKNGFCSIFINNNGDDVIPVIQGDYGNAE